MPEVEDRHELVRRFRAGDGDAFQVLFDATVPVLRGRVLRRLPANLSKRLSVADVIQEAGLEAFRRRETFENRGPGAFRNWLLGIVDHKVREAVRYHGRTCKRASNREITRSRRPDTLAFAAASRSPSVAAIASERIQRVQRAMATLPEDYQQVLRLALERGLVLREVAERIGRSREATKKLYGRALCRLREACGPGGASTDG